MKNIFFITILLFIASCQSDNKSQGEVKSEIWNPPAKGFNLKGSDPEAIKVADEVMQAMGGRKAWNKTDCITWNFFGVRKLVWEKPTGMVRIDYLNQDMKAVFDIHTKKGQIWKDGRLLQNKDSLNKYLDQAYRVWVNDSYWLFMPFKLKDSGVTLKYMGEDTTNAGDPADELQMTFKDVGVTPQNKYHVWVDKNNHLVTQWAYFREYSQDKPNFVLPWKNYEKYGNILLSGDRGERQITDIAVYENPPNGIFNL